MPLVRCHDTSCPSNKDERCKARDVALHIHEIKRDDMGNRTVLLQCEEVPSEEDVFEEEDW